MNLKTIKDTVDAVANIAKLIEELDPDATGQISMPVLASTLNGGDIHHPGRCRTKKTTCQAKRSRRALQMKIETVLCSKDVA